MSQSNEVKAIEGAVVASPFCGAHLDWLVTAARRWSSSAGENAPWWATTSFGHAEAKRFLARVSADRSAVVGDCLVFGPQEQPLEGLTGVSHIDWIHGCCQVAFWFLPGTPPQQRVQALTSVARWARTRGLVRLELLLPEGDESMQTVAQAAGALREGILRKRLLLDGHRLDAVLYALT